MLAVRVKPRAARDALTADAGRAVVQVRAPAVEGQANRAVIEVVADALDLPKSAVTIARGQRSRDKVLRIAGLSPADLRERLCRARVPPRAEAEAGLGKPALHDQESPREARKKPRP